MFALLVKLIEHCVCMIELASCYMFVQYEYNVSNGVVTPIDTYK